MLLISIQLVGSNGLVYRSAVHAKSQLTTATDNQFPYLPECERASERLNERLSCVLLALSDATSRADSAGSGERKTGSEQQLSSAHTRRLTMRWPIISAGRRLTTGGDSKRASER